MDFFVRGLIKRLLGSPVPDGGMVATSGPAIVWSLLATGLEPVIVNNLCLSLRHMGFEVVLRDPPSLPYCELQVIGNAAKVKSRMADDRPSDNPIELGETLRFADTGELVRSLPVRVRDLLVRTERYCALVRSIRSRKTIAFVGSGLSVEAGYPNWSALLKTLAREAGLAYTDVELSAGGRVALEIAESCKRALPNYHAILQREFAPRAPGFTGLHVELIQMPFASYVTTNFDHCLEVAAEHVSKSPGIQIAPAFTTTYVGRGDIFYLHGRVPRENDVGQCRIEWLRLTTDDYRQAYQEDPLIADLIGLAMKEAHTLFFVGYGLREEAVREVLDRALTQMTARNKWLENQGVGLGATRPHFALVPRGEIGTKEVDELVEKCNVQIIEFSKEDNFMEQKQILKDLFYRTRDITAPSIRGVGQILPADGASTSG